MNRNRRFFDGITVEGFSPILMFRFGFTLIELLVVVAIISVLAGLLLSAISNSQRRGYRVACSSNMRQFGVAWHLYAADNGDHLPPNMGGRKVPLGITWIEGWLGLPGPDCTNTLYLHRSLLGRYLNNSKVWRCPSAEPVTLGGITQPRVRTVSLNGFMGSPIKSPAAATYIRMSDIIRPSPAEALTFLEERIETINDGAFAFQWPFDEKKPSTWTLRDKPSIIHEEGGNLVFSDGHVEAHRWKDARTISAPRDDSVSPGNRDILWLQQHATWRESKR